jgi:hypothetical protein
LTPLDSINHKVFLGIFPQFLIFGIQIQKFLNPRLVTGRYRNRSRPVRPVTAVTGPVTTSKVNPGPSTFSDNIPFFHWQDGQDSACLVHATGFHGDFGSVYCMSQCDGLVRAAPACDFGRLLRGRLIWGFWVARAPRMQLICV